MKKLLIIPIALLILSGCTTQEAVNRNDIRDIYQLIFDLQHKTESLISPSSCESSDFMEARIRIMLLQKDGYSWEQEGIRFTAEVKNACISSDDKWATTPVPFGFQNVPSCDELTK